MTDETIIEKMRQANTMLSNAIQRAEEEEKFLKQRLGSVVLEKEELKQARETLYSAMHGMIERDGTHEKLQRAWRGDSTTRDLPTLPPRPIIGVKT